MKSEPMTIYLAARYSRRLELVAYAAQLEGLGHKITSRWLAGNHEVADADREPERALQLKQKYAAEDVMDVYAAECIISFTEDPNIDVPGRSRGGRHVEFGLGYGVGRRMIVVGPRENIFHWLKAVEVYDTFDAMVGAL